MEKERSAGTLGNHDRYSDEVHPPVFCNFPVALPFYIAGAVLLALVFFPRQVELIAKSQIVWLAGAAVFVVGMLLLPSRNHLMGDGMQRLGEGGVTIMFSEPLDTAIHRLVFLLTGSALWSYRLVGFVAGLFYLNGVRLLSRFGETTIEKSVIVLAFLCTATIQFCFGYVENYGLLNLFILYFIYFSWKSLSEERATVLPLLFFLLATASHLSGVVLFPSLLVVYRNRFPRLIKWSLPLTAIAVCAAVYFGYQQRYLVPTMANDYSDYSLFSMAHLRDLLCTLLLISPAFFLALLGKRWDRVVAFTAVALGGTFLYTIMIDPVLGAVRDWDMLSIFALPLAGLIALRAPRRYWVTVILAVVIVVRIIPWLAFNSRLQLDYMKAALSSDIHYSDRFAGGERLDSWGYLLWISGDLKGADEMFKEKLRINPNWVNTLSMLGRLQLRMEDNAGACDTYSRLTILEPENLANRYKAALLLFRLGSYDSAQSLISSAPPGFREDPTVARLQAGIFGATGRHAEALRIIQVPAPPDLDGYLPYMLAKSCLILGSYDLARQLIDRAIELDYFNQTYRDFAAKIPRQ